MPAVPETPAVPATSPAAKAKVPDGVWDGQSPLDVPALPDVPAAPKSLVLDLNRTAVIVIDMQNDFCTPGGWLDHIGVDTTPARRPVAPLQSLLPALRHAEVPVIWVNWGNREDLMNISPALRHVYNGSGRDVGLGDPVPGTGAPVLQKDSWGAAVIRWDYEFAG